MDFAAAKSYASTAPLTPVAPKAKPAATAVAHMEFIPDSSLTEDETVAVATKAHDSCDFASLASIVSIDLGCSSAVRRIFALIAKEAEMEMSDLTDDAAFVSISVDSLVNLAIMAQIYDKFGVNTGGSLIIKYPIL